MSDSVKDEVYGKVARFEQEPAIKYRTKTPEHELSGMLREHLGKVLERGLELDASIPASVRTELDKLAATEGEALTLLPEIAFLEVRGEGDQPNTYVTLLREVAHTNVAQLLREEERLLPKEDRLAVLKGFVGAYPSMMFSLARAELPGFVAMVRSLDGESTYAKLCDKYGVRRTNPQFWPLSDRMRAAFSELAPRHAGLFDFNRYEDP